MASDRPQDAERASDLDAGPEPALHLPVLEAGTGAPPVEAKPTWRGWVHAGTFPVAIAAGIVLIVLADGTLAKFACALYALCSWLLFGISALYHRFNWSERTRVALKRFDHANIFLLISGTYAPISLVALPPAQGWPLFGVVWGAAFLGICFRVFWIGAPRWLYVALYILLGWAAVAYLGEIARVNVATVVLIAAGGLLYTAGAIFYATKRPNLWPGHFGFHELFHVFTVLAFLSQWAGILLLCLDPPVFG